MKRDAIERLLEEVAAGSVGAGEAGNRIRDAQVENLDFARVDHIRPLTQGHQEVVMCSGKKSEQVVKICEALHRASGTFLATRAGRKIRAELAVRFPGAEVNELARTVFLRAPDHRVTGVGDILVICAGTSDLPVAEEADTVADAMGNRVVRLNDVGVAGIHRLLEHGEQIRNANVLIVIAGMDGALPSVIGGMVSAPVIAVPTSVGYGASFGGLAALLSMLNSCASGVTVTNIDNGFGAAMAASRINRSQ